MARRRASSSTRLWALVRYRTVTSPRSSPGGDLGPHDVHQPGGLVLVVEEFLLGQQVAVAAAGPQVLALALLVVGDDLVGRGQDVARAAVVLLQAEGDRARESTRRTRACSRCGRRARSRWTGRRRPPRTGCRATLVSSLTRTSCRGLVSWNSSTSTWRKRWAYFARTSSSCSSRCTVRRIRSSKSRALHLRRAVLVARVDRGVLLVDEGAGLALRPAPAPMSSFFQLADHRARGVGRELLGVDVQVGHAPA